MKLDELYATIKNHKPQLLYLSGKTCVGKSTFSAKLRNELGYSIIELDKLVVESVMQPQGLTDAGTVFIEVYRGSNRQLLDPFIRAVRDVIAQNQTRHQPIVIEGAVANADTLSEMFSEHPELMSIYLHPSNLEDYERNITSRFMLARKDHNPGLPQHFWELVDDAEFETFCEQRVITPSIARSIKAYAAASQEESLNRLARLRARFPDMVVVEV